MTFGNFLTNGFQHHIPGFIQAWNQGICTKRVSIHIHAHKLIRKVDNFDWIEFDLIFIVCLYTSIKQKKYYIKYHLCDRLICTLSNPNTKY